MLAESSQITLYWKLKKKKKKKKGNDILYLLEATITIIGDLDT